MSHERLSLEIVKRQLKAYHQAAETFYFRVLFSKYRCPSCHGELRITGPSRATCRCGLTLDPTVQFQTSQCCDAPVGRKLLHYACTNCGAAVASKFLFNERLFNREYFRKAMAASRERRRAKDGLKSHLILRSSGGLLMEQQLSLESIEGLLRDIDEMCSVPPALGSFMATDEGPMFDLSRYWSYVRSALHPRGMLLSEISPLYPDKRRDRVWLFITLVYMEHDQEVYLSECGDDVLVEWA